MKKRLVMLVVAFFSFALAFSAAEAGPAETDQKALAGYNKANLTLTSGSSGGGVSAPAAARLERRGPYWCGFGGYVVRITSSISDSRGGAYVYIGYWQDNLYTPYDDSTDIGKYYYIFYAANQQLQDLRAAKFDSARPYIYGNAISYIPCAEREYWNGGTVWYVDSNPNAELANDEEGYGKE